VLVPLTGRAQGGEPLGVLASQRKKAGKMKRNLKVLGLALTAVFAMSAMAAAGASAQTPATFSYGPNSGALIASAKTPQVFTTDVGELTCKKIATETNTSKFTSNSELTATVKPLYTECSKESTTLVVDFTKCHYKFYAATTGEHANVDIVCDSPSEKPHVKAVVLGFQLNCVTVEQQTVNGAVSYANTTEGGVTDVDVKATATNIKYTIEGVCHEGSEPTTTGNGTYTGEVTVRAENTAGEIVNGSWTKAIP
jgi:hypothetical protein